MKLLLVAALIFAFGCAIRDRSYIQLLEAEILVRDLVIKDYQDQNIKNLIKALGGSKKTILSYAGFELYGFFENSLRESLPFCG